jgi:hypothetical protein
MALTDILQVDDNENVREYFDDLRKEIGQELKRKVSYKGISSLSELREYLGRGDRAKLYILDGDFFDVPNGRIDTRVAAAIDLIREYVPEAKNILVFSANINVEDIATQYNVGFLLKGPGTSKDETKKEIKKYLNSYKP